ncbi:MAG: FAD-dependent oxidoreductase [Rhodococcus sp. (in: high G+C Gram-positive bacteria)]|nr:MAG: FAD-dependent oxidoreductase [Rhodococcus sp. (in: high G+C Gram-positive bacteria)]
MTLSDECGWDGEEWDRVVDVIVVGTGAAGGAAAAAASRAGASVLILDKAEFPGGTTARSGGGMWIPNNFTLREQGRADDRDRCIQYMAHSAYPAHFRADHPTYGIAPEFLDLIEGFFDHAAEVVDELRADGVLTLDAYHFPDYYSDLPEAVTWGHAIVPRLPADWKRGDPGGGELLADQLRKAAEKRGGETLLNCHVVGLLHNTDGDMIGVEAHLRRKTVLLGARRGVIFGSGGFLHNQAMTDSFLRGPIFGGAAAATSTGDFIAMATRAGATLANMSQAWWDQLVVEQAVHHRVTSRDVFYAYGDAMLMVNSRGKRALNEKAPYTDRGQAHFYWDTGRHEYPNRLMFMLFDDTVRQSDLRSDPGIRGSKMGRYPVPFPGEDPSYVISGNTWVELIDKLQDRLTKLAPEIGVVDLSEDFLPTLEDTIERFNRQARSGSDPDFRRGETLIEKAWSSTTRVDALNDSLYPIGDSGPYHCVILGAGALDTKGGPLTDVQGRVLNPQGTPVPGLYGAGNCVASPSGQAYWGPGTTIGLGLTFGYLAGRHAATQTGRQGAIVPN